MNRRRNNNNWRRNERRNQNYRRRCDRSHYYGSSNHDNVQNHGASTSSQQQQEEESHYRLYVDPHTATGRAERQPQEPKEPPYPHVSKKWPSLYYDPATDKYHSIAPDIPHQASMTLSELRKVRNEYERTAFVNRLERSREDNIISGGDSQRNSLPFLLDRLSLGVMRRAPYSLTYAKRHVAERCLRSLHQKASYSFDVMDNHNPDRQFTGCSFLDARDDGRTLAGCWSTGDFGGHWSRSRFISYNVSANAHEAQKHLKSHDRLLALEEERRCAAAATATDDDGGFEDIAMSNGGQWRTPTPLTAMHVSGNTYGLRFVPDDNLMPVRSTLIDMTIVKPDNDVTCLLYANAAPYMSSRGAAITDFIVTLQAIEQFTRAEGQDAMLSPIYNFSWRTRHAVWSCGFNSNQMRICIGQDNRASIYDLLSNHEFRVSSGGKNVISQQFSKNGDLIYLGRLADDIWISDLRVKQQHHIGGFIDSKSTCFMHQMEHQPDYIFTDNFEGKMKMFDVRMHGIVLEFNGHDNSSHKLPCFVDEDERFVFAVGEDGIARGWSLTTGGDPICQLVCPKTESYANSDFPRIVYSPRWGGLAGNSALILAVNDQIHVHELHGI